MLFNILVILYLILCIWGLIGAVKNRNILAIIFSSVAIGVFVYSMYNMAVLIAEKQPINPVW